MEPELLPLVEKMLPDIVNELADPHDLHLPLLRSFATRLKPLLPFIDADLRSPAIADSIQFFSLLCGPLYPIVLVVRLPFPPTPHTSYMPIVFLHSCWHKSANLPLRARVSGARLQVTNRQEPGIVNEATSNPSTVTISSNFVAAPRKHRGDNEDSMMREADAVALLRLAFASDSLLKETIRRPARPMRYRAVCGLSVDCGWRLIAFRFSSKGKQSTEMPMPMPCCQCRVCLSRVAIHGSAPAQVAKKIAAAIHQLRLSVESDANTPSDAQAQYLLPQPYTSTHFGYSTGSNATGHSLSAQYWLEYLRPPERKHPCYVTVRFRVSTGQLANEL